MRFLRSLGELAASLALATEELLPKGRLRSGGKLLASEFAR